MISGECHVEGIPSPGSSSPGDRKFVLDGLRLRLDLRIVPSASGGDATAAAIWRIETDRLATLSLCAPATVRRIAMAAGVAALALALGVWFLASPMTPTDPRWASEPAESTAGGSPVGAAAPASERAMPSKAASASARADAAGSGAARRTSAGGTFAGGTFADDTSAGGTSGDRNGPPGAQSTAAPARATAPVTSVRSTPEPGAIGATTEPPQPIESAEPYGATRVDAPRITVQGKDAAGSTPISGAPGNLRPEAPAGSPSRMPSRMRPPQPDTAQRAARPSTGGAGASRRTASAELASHDMLELFGDTK